MEWNTPFPKEEIIEKVTENMVKFADQFGKHLVQGGLTTNQLRKFFGEVKRQQMEGFNKSEFILLKPKLAYAVGRDKKIMDFYKVMSQAIDLVNNNDQFKNFIKFFEATVAYHKYYEEQKKNTYRE